MAFLGGVGKALGLGSTKDVTRFAANAAASYYSGGAVPLQTSPFEQSEPQVMNNPFELQSRNMRMQNIGTATSGSSGSFFGSLGQTLGDFGRGARQFLGDIEPLTSFFGGGASQIQRTNAGPAQTINPLPPAETSTSGEITQANLGAAPAIFGAARNLLGNRAVQGIIGGGAGLAGGALMVPDARAPRITRRMKSDVRKIYMMAGMDPDATAQIMNELRTYPKFNFNAGLVFLILTKRFRNDGPVVTKAAVRKTKTTLRRMKGVVDMYNSVCKPTPRRAAPRRTASKAVQLIKN